MDHLQMKQKILGIDNVSIATDDMTFTEILEREYEDRNIFNYKNVKKEIKELLKKYYSEEDIEKILHKNIENKFWRQKNDRYKINKRKQ